MAKLDPKKLGALVDKHAQKKAPPKKPGGGFPPKKGQPPSDHAKKEAEHEGGGETPEHEQAEHDEGHDKEIAEAQAARVANGNADDSLHDLAGDIGGGGEDDEDKAPPAWAVDHDVWERAEKAVDELAELDEEDRGIVLVHTYQALGGEIQGHGEDGGEHGGDDEHEDDDHEHDGGGGEDHE